MELPQQMRMYREQLGLSQEDVAHKIYVSRQTMSSWENGKTYPDVQSLLLLSDLFGVSIDELVKGDVISMKEMVSKDAVRMERLTFASIIFMLAGIVCVISFYVAWRDPSFIPAFTIGDLAGLGAFIGFFIPAMVCIVKIEKIKKNRNLVTYREISAFMDGDAIPEDSEAISRRYPLLSSMIKVLCGAGVGLVVLFAITVTLKVLH